MLLDNKVKRIKQQNYHKIREIMRISLSLGVNLTSPSRFKDSLKIINILLTVSSILSMYGHWCYTKRNIKDLTKIAESICTALQVIVSIFKMIFYLFYQRKFYILLSQAQGHDILMKTEIFQKDFVVAKKLNTIIGDIMDSSWKDIRRQIIFFLSSCIAISCNYFFMALFVNIYHQIQATPNYEPKFPFPSIYPMWEGKGLTFPSYPIQMYLGGCDIYLAGMTACSFDGVFIVLCVHGIGLIQSLNVMIENSTASEVPKERRVEYLRYCILTYQRIYDYVLNLDKLYKHITLSQFLLSLIIWGIVLFQASISLGSSKSTLIRMLLFLLSAGFEVVLYCYNSQRLSNEFEKIPLAFYNCEWYNESNEFKQLILMMILRTNRMFDLKISWFRTMSLPTLLVMVKTSGSYFVLLRNLSE